MLDFNELKKRTVPNEIAVWMCQNGTNHVRMSAVWQTSPKVLSNLDRVLDCIAWSLQRGESKEVPRRLLHRYQKLRTDKEREMLGLSMIDTPDCLL